ncbi:PA2169 family four-helix-bundle protein [Altibacter sp.]|uniref:ferritin-like domain-containing protein n=1 Tax=Altibacter sp. TaxID=2024823 RepID=UPI002586C09A|nr:PA2169 family four-helix-bundle protein [Altibacter sp.]MCW8981330.1 PA2169 family four-helix-bundle protein [Altibacter sp.]MCW9038211.1 PA2169 family four-helix-bundle protein [Altibacter sp.]
MKTTREEAKENIHDDLVDNLQGLLEKNYDAEKGFTKAMKNAKDDRLKSFLKHQAAQRNRFATELDKEIRSLNETPKESGSTTGALHRTWIDVKTAFTGDDDEAVLEECIRGDKASVEEYEEKLNDNRFPPQISSVLTNQLSQIKSTLNTVKKLEDLEDNWS